MQGPLKALLKRYRWCVIGVESVDENGDVGIGTAFHIGDGYFVTARHVLEGRTVTDIVQSGGLAEVQAVHAVVFHEDPTVDLAIISTTATHAEAIDLGNDLTALGEQDLVLDEVLLLGYPPIPFARQPELFAIAGQVNGELWRRDGDTQYLISTPARGGFSGGPVVHESGQLLGVLIEALGRREAPWEAPVAAVLSTGHVQRLLLTMRVAPLANRKNLFVNDAMSIREQASIMSATEQHAARKWYEGGYRREDEPVSWGKPSFAMSETDTPLWTRTSRSLQGTVLGLSWADPIN